MRTLGYCIRWIVSIEPMSHKVSIQRKLMNLEDKREKKRMKKDLGKTLACVYI
jgi:hypothetical protein